MIYDYLPSMNKFDCAAAYVRTMLRLQPERPGACLVPLLALVLYVSLCAFPESVGAASLTVGATDSDIVYGGDYTEYPSGCDEPSRFLANGSQADFKVTGTAWSLGCTPAVLACCQAIAAE